MPRDLIFVSPLQAPTADLTVGEMGHPLYACSKTTAWFSALRIAAGGAKISVSKSPVAAKCEQDPIGQQTLARLSMSWLNPALQPVLPVEGISEEPALTLKDNDPFRIRKLHIIRRRSPTYFAWGWMPVRALLPRLPIPGNAPIFGRTEQLIRPKEPSHGRSVPISSVRLGASTRREKDPEKRSRSPAVRVGKCYLVGEISRA